MGGTGRNLESRLIFPLLMGDALVTDIEHPLCSLGSRPRLVGPAPVAPDGGACDSSIRRSGRHAAAIHKGATLANTDLLLQALRSFAVAMSGSFDTTDVCHGLGTTVMEVVGASGAGVSVVDKEGNLKFVTATSQSIVEIEEAQEGAQQGPCVTAFQTQKPMAIPDIADRTDWPVYTDTADRIGLRAVVGYPFTYGGESLGALNVYNAEPREWSDEDLGVIGVFADMATAYLARTSELAEARQLADQLQTALDSRVLIEQAKGILANQHGVTVDEAFEMLRTHSRSNRLRLSQLADAVVNMGLRLPNRDQ